MNRHYKTFLLVLGGALLVAGGAIFAVGCKDIKNTSLTREYDLSDKTFENFNIDVATSDVEFVFTTDSTKKIVYKETEKHYHTEEVKDSTLYIKQEESIKWYERVFTFDFAPKKATIYLPIAEYKELKILGSTGDVKIPHDFTFNNLDIKISTGDVDLNCNVLNESKIQVSTGDVEIEEMNAKSLFVHRSTGDLSMKNVSVTDSIIIEGDTGSVDLENVTSDSLKITSSTGNVKMKNVKTVNDINIKTSTGDIKFEDIDFKNGEMKTSTGDVKGSLSSPKSIDGHSGTGKEQYKKVSASGSLVVNTSTGDIVINF